MYGEKYRPFVVGAIIGCILWSISAGFIHAYVICPDWEAMGNNAVAVLFQWRSFVALICTGFVFGLSVEIAKFMGAVFRSDGAIFFLPVLAGVSIGVLQGYFIDSSFWGFGNDVVFRGEFLRCLTGAICGLLLTYPTIMIGITIRQRGRHW